MKSFALIILLFASAIQAAEKRTNITLWERNFSYPLVMESINIALSKTMDEYGDYHIKPSIPLEEGRAFSNLAIGDDIDVAIGGVSIAREAKLLPVYIPIDRGLAGFKVCLTNSAHPGFANIQTLRDFKKQKSFIGLGTHWPDKEVFEYNGIRPNHSVNFKQLFQMVAKSRFDCLPRGITDIDQDMQQFSELELTTDKHIAFVYPYATFIFVSPTQERLHARLSKGLKFAIEDGSYRRLYNKYFKKTLKQHGFYNRKLLIMQNENLSVKALKAINKYGVASFVN